MKFRAVASAFVIVMIVFLVYVVCFKTREPNYFQKVLQDHQLEQLDRYNKALELLKNKNYSEAEKTTMMDYPFQPVVGNRTEQDDKEADIFYFSKFMLTDDDDPITKYSYLLSIEAIEGVVTEEELNNLKADWSLKSDAATQYVAKQKSDALQGLNEEEKSFVERYMLESIDGKTPDPAVVATHSTFNLTADEASNKAADWMIDPRILKAIEKYKTISNKYGRDNEK